MKRSRKFVKVSRIGHVQYASGAELKFRVFAYSVNQKADPICLMESDDEGHVRELCKQINALLHDM